MTYSNIINISFFFFLSLDKDKTSKGENKISIYMLAFGDYWSGMHFQE